MSVIALIGLTGAGKTSAGQLVAKWTARDFIDIDAAILEQTGRTVRQLVEEGGTEAYRGLESRVLIEALETDDDVLVAVPGEALLDPRVRAGLGQAFVIWLRAQPATLAARVEGEDHRVLHGSDAFNVLQDMAADMRDLYEEASDLVVDTDTRDIDEVGRCIVDSLRAYGRD